MKIFFLSDTAGINEPLKEALKKEILLCGNKIAYISSTKQEGERKYYASTISDYRAISENISVDYFDLSSGFSDADLEKLLDYKIIYLSGGNTYAFLKDAKERNLKNILERATKQGALLIGASAGAIMMTPTIDVCSLEDENAVNLSDTSGFGFVDFEFSPHFKESDGELLLNYKKGGEIYLCKDGDGIFYNEGEVKIFGEITKI